MKYYTEANVRNRLYFYDEKNDYGYYEYNNGFWKKYRCESFFSKNLTEIMDDTFLELLMEKR